MSTKEWYMVNKVIIYIDMISYDTKGINFALRNIASNSIPSRITTPYSQYEQTSYSTPTNPLLFLLFPILRQAKGIYWVFVVVCDTVCNADARCKKRGPAQRKA
jgi:hypothetical protein